MRVRRNNESAGMRRSPYASRHPTQSRGGERGELKMAGDLLSNPRRDAFTRRALKPAGGDCGEGRYVIARKTETTKSLPEPDMKIRNENPRRAQVAGPR